MISTSLAVLRWMACGHTGPPEKAVAGWTQGLMGHPQAKPIEIQIQIAIEIEMLPGLRWDFGNDCVV
jgi:hypothetical protein